MKTNTQSQPLHNGLHSSVRPASQPVILAIHDDLANEQTLGHTCHEATLARVGIYALRIKNQSVTPAIPTSSTTRSLRLKEVETAI
ncbi:hypothetical protein E2C01_074236 [Portunus trituberculatus]|uniref:Uncharacterized protein n=1 Tax=Portunus trituberculatus TaxID=210409 RepID=A0A5B7IBW1_PORTR|nr:hypothetical protein [Portunus trituberculatus]